MPSQVSPRSCFRKVPTFRPSVELLEERLPPGDIFWTGGTLTGLAGLFPVQPERAGADTPERIGRLSEAAAPEQAPVWDALAELAGAEVPGRFQAGLAAFRGAAAAPASDEPLDWLYSATTQGGAPVAAPTAAAVLGVGFDSAPAGGVAAASTFVAANPMAAGGESLFAAVNSARAVTKVTQPVQRLNNTGGPLAERNARARGDQEGGLHAPARPATTWERPSRIVDSAATASPPDGKGLGPNDGPFFLSTNSEPDADLPFDLAFAPDGNTVVIVHWFTDNITFFDMNTLTVTDTVSVGRFPTHVAVTPDGQYAVVPNALSHTVSVIDMASRTLVADVPITGEQPFRVALTSDSRYAIVSVINDAVQSSFSVIDLAKFTEALSFPSASQGVIGSYGDTESGNTGPIFTQFALAPDDSAIVLPDRRNSRIVLYDPFSGTELAALEGPAQPYGVHISSDSTTAVVGHEGNSRRLTKIDLPSRTVTGSFPTPGDLFVAPVRITPSQSHALVAITNAVAFVNLTTGTTDATLSTGAVGDIEISYDGRYAFVSNFNSSVIDIEARRIVATIPFAPSQEAATSPVSLQAVALNSRFREDIHVYDIDGPNSHFEGFASTGALPEGDATRMLAIAPDGVTVVAANNTSRNVAFLDLKSFTVTGYVDTGDRPLDLAVTPDGAYAVVTNAESGTVSIIDMSTRERVANLNIPNRPARVRISPDSQMAYVLNVAGEDRIHFIQLAGPKSAVVGSTPAGQTGSAFAYAFTEVSGIELSPDGSILAVCASFDNRLRLIDTATGTLLTDVTVGDFPIRAAFSPDGTRAYVSNLFGQTVSVVAIDGASSRLLANVSVGNSTPLTLDVDAAGAYVYVGSTGTSGGVRVLDAKTNTIVQTLPFPMQAGPRGAHLSSVDSKLYVASTGSQFVVIDAQGPASAIVETGGLTSTPSNLVFSEAFGYAVAALPIPDGVDVFRWSK